MTGNKIAMIKATLKYTKQAEVIEAMKPLISSRGLFILTRTTRPVGSEVHFEFKLADNSITYAGEGIVRKEIPFVGGPSSQRSGMLVALRKINRPFKEVVDAVIGAQQQSDRSITPSSMQAVPPEAIKPEDKAETGAEAAPVAESAAVASSPVNSSIVDTKNSGESLDLFGDSDMEEELDFLFSGIGKKPEVAPQMTKSSAFTQASLFGDAEGTDEFNFDDSIDMDDMDLNDIEADGFDESAAINEIAGEAEAVLKKCEDAHTTATAIHAGDDDATPVPDKSATSSDEDVMANQTMTGLPCVSESHVSSDDKTPSKSLPAVHEEEEVSEPTEQLSDSSIERVLHKAANIIETPETESHIDKTLQDADDAMASADESIAAANAVLAANAAAAEAEEAIAVAEAAVEAANNVATDAASTDAENEEARAVAETAIAAAQDAIVAAQDAVQIASDKDEALKENIAAEAAETEHIEVAESDSVADAETRVVSTEPEFKEVLSTPLVDVSADKTESPSEVFEALRGQFLEEGERLSQAQAAESPSEVFETLRDQFLEEGERLSNGEVAADADSEKTEGSSSSVFESLRAQILEESSRLNKEMSYESSVSPLDDVIRDYSGSENSSDAADDKAPETEAKEDAKEEAVAESGELRQDSKSGFKSAEAESLFSALQEDISKPVESASKSLIENLVNGTPVAPDTQRPSSVSRSRSQSSEQNSGVRTDKAVSSSDNAKVEKKDSEDLDLSALVKTQESLILNSGKESTGDSIDISKMPKRERKSLKSEVDESANQKKGFFGRLFGK